MHWAPQDAQLIRIGASTDPAGTLFRMSQDVVCECRAGEHGHPLDLVASSPDSAAALAKSTVHFAPEAERHAATI